MSSSRNSRTLGKAAMSSSSFAKARKAEADLGRSEGSTDTGLLRTLTKRELDELATGFLTIRDQEPLDDVADWANAVLALIEDEAARPRPY